MIKYRNVQDGREVTVLEPHDEPVRREKPRALAIKRFEASPQWERVDAVDRDDGDSDGTGEVPSEVQVREAGGGWYELLLDGDVVDKVRGREAADKAAAELADSP